MKKNSISLSKKDILHPILASLEESGGFNTPNPDNILTQKNYNISTENSPTKSVRNAPKDHGSNSKTHRHSLQTPHKLSQPNEEGNKVLKGKIIKLGNINSKLEEWVYKLEKEQLSLKKVMKDENDALKRLIND